ncbi:hypothetical protein LPJ59_003753 [Coemansia sp. RSA 2399]|nr:hypothetical protein LPJ59_003753 [Coemansia sp. RSA 2399]
MRPDPHKQKSSRRYQAKNGEHLNVRSERHRAAAVPEQPRFDELAETQQTDDTAEASQQEAEDFLEYLKDESTNQQQASNAAFFKLREEIDSEELDKYADGVWNQLMDVDVDLLTTSLAHSSRETPLNKLLGFGNGLAVEFPIPPPPSNTKPRQDTVTAAPRQRFVAKPPLASSSATVSSASLAPNLKQTKPAPLFRAPKKQEAPPPQQPTKAQKPADDLEAFLDDIL